MYINNKVSVAANGSNTDVLVSKRIKDIPPAGPYPYLVSLWIAANDDDLEWELYVNDESVVERSDCKHIIEPKFASTYAQPDNTVIGGLRGFPDRDRDFATSFVAPAQGGRLQLQVYGGAAAANVHYAIEVSPIVQ